MARLLRLLVLGLVFVLGSSTARAQAENAELVVAGGLPFSGRDLAAFCKTAGLDGQQAAAAHGLYQGYRASYSAKLKEAKRRLDELGEKSSDADLTHQIGAGMDAFADEASKLERRLMDDLGALCTPAQAEGLAAAQRERHRHTGLVFAMNVNEGIDLVSILRELKIDRHSIPGLDAAVSQWEADLDRLLVEKDKIVHGHIAGIMGMAGDEQVYPDLCAIGARIGEVNRRGASQVRVLLPEAQQVKLDNAIKLRIFPKIYGPSAVSKLIEAAEKVNGVTGEQLARLKELVEAYVRELGPVNDRLAAAAQDKQSKILELGFFEIKDQNAPLVVARKDRRALNERYRARVMEVLTAEQRELLPKEAPPKGRAPEFVADFDSDFREAVKEWDAEGG